MDFAQRLALHNAQVELEALRAEGRWMVWQNESLVHQGQPPYFGETDFNALATRIRATKVQIDDAVLMERLRG